MYKILFASGSLSQNGTEMFMMNVLRHIDRTRFHIDFCIYSDEITPNRIEAESYGCKVFVLPQRRHGPLRSVIAACKFMKKHAWEYNVIHWNGGNLSSLMILVVSWLYRIPIRIVHAHSSSAVGVHNIILHKFHRQFLRLLCTHFFACSLDAARFFFKRKNAIIIKNGINVEKYDYSEHTRLEVRKDLGLPLNAQVIGHVGRFDNNKNHSFLLDVFTQYSIINENAYLLLVGNGTTYETIKEKVKELGLEGKVIFTGVRNDVNRLMQAMDCFVMPSIFEGLPFVLIEAQCSGLPCIISDTVSSDVRLTNNVKFMSLQKDAAEWSQIIQTELNSYCRRSNAKIIAEKGFSIRDIVRNLENIYSNNTKNNYKK